MSKVFHIYKWQTFSDCKWISFDNLTLEIVEEMVSASAITYKRSNIISEGNCGVLNFPKKNIVTNYLKDFCPSL